MLFNPKYFQAVDGFKYADVTLRRSFVSPLEGSQFAAVAREKRSPSHRKSRYLRWVKTLKLLYFFFTFLPYLSLSNLKTDKHAFTISMAQIAEFSLKLYAFQTFIFNFFYIIRRFPFQIRSWANAPKSERADTSELPGTSTDTSSCQTSRMPQRHCQR